MSDYLKLAQELTPTPAPVDNPYLSIVQDEQRQSQARARTVLETAFKDNPDIAAERQRLSQTSGLPLRVIERNLDAVRAKEQARAVDLISMANDSPVLARQLLDPTFTTTAVDDLETLKKVERSIGHAVRYVMGADGKGGLPADLPKAATDVALGATAGVGEMIFNLAAVLNDTLGWDTGAAAARGQANRSRDARKEFGLDPESTTGEAVKSGLGSAGTNLAVLPMGLARGAFATAEAAATLPAAIMGAGVGADAYLQAREKGKSGVQAALFGVPQGTFEYLLERVPASKLFGDIAANSGLARTLGHQVVSEGWTEQVTTLLQDFNEWVNLNPEKSAAQFIAERPDAAYQTFIATLVGVGVQTTTLHAVNKIVEKASDSALTFQQDALEEQMKLIASSMLRQRSPEQFRAYVERVVEETEGARKEVYVDAEVLSQLPQDVLSQLPQSVRDAIPEALAANGTVAIPMVDVLTIAPGTALEQTLNDHARMTPDAITRAEAAAAAETLQQDAERVLAQAQDQEAARAEFDAVQADLAQQITTTGRYRPQVAETYAAGLAHFFAAYGSRTGLGTKGLYDAYKSRGFRIVGEAGTQGNTLEATLPGTISVEGYHFSKQARPSLSTAFYGTGLKGSARDEIMSNPDARLQKRLSFYFDKGTGVRPEAGVGGIAHRARLTNIYDADADVLGLRSGDARAFESALLDRGYSGYATRLEGTQPGQVILLGDQTVTPEVLGPRSSIAAGEVVPALPAEEARWATVASGDGVEARLERMRSLPAWADYDLRVENGELQARPREAVFTQPRVKTLTPAVRKLLKNLTSEEQDKITDLTAAKIIGVLQDLPSSKEMAAVAYAGRAKRGWYKNSADAISTVFGADAPRFAALLAAMSPQTSVENNLYNALSTWKNWVAAGRPQSKAEIVAVMGRSVMGNKLTDSVLPAWINNSVRALTNEDPGKTRLSGPKVDSFFRNLVGVVDEVTNDAWMANYALIDQKIFAGRLNVAGTDPGKGKGYLAMSARVREAAATLTKLSGETWTPAEVQETIWSWAKTLYESAESAESTRTARQLVEDRALSDEAINATPDFATLFRNPTYASILGDAGYGPELKRLARLADENAASRSGAGGQAAPFTADDQLRLELQAARRLERLADARGDARAAAAEQRADEALTDGAYEQRPEQTGDRGGRYSSGSGAPLAGAPNVAGASGPDARLVAVAEQYARDNGIQLRRQGEYARVDPERAKRIAAAYEEMKHAPDDPRVREAYDDLIRQTMAQYLALTKAGYRFTFMDPAADPYQGNPWNAMRDLRANQHMAVFPTDAGFGSGATLNIGLADPLGGPNLSTERVMAALVEAGATVKASATHTSNTEPTLVVELAAPLTAEAATALAETLGQEAIAQRLGDGSGGLFGPGADRWGEFNPEYFLTFSGKTAAATANPLLADTGLEWSLPDGTMKRVLANDLFRAVHDAFGHGLEGAGFRAQGEENAWQAHVRLFTGPAVGAITSETRGQNSWLNFGPHGEKNQTAAVEDTVFADQKTGLMPEWTWTEGRVGDESDVLNQPAYHGTHARGIDKFSLDKIGTGEGAQAYGWGLYFAESKDIAEFYKGVASRANIRRQFQAELPDDADFEEVLDNLDKMTPQAARVIGALANEDWLGFDYPSQAINAIFGKNADNYDITYELRDAIREYGQLYEVEVPEDSDLLDYDAPLKDQPPKVKAALEKLGVPLTVYNVVDASGNIVTSQESREKARLYITKSNVAGKVVEAPSDLDGKRAYKLLSLKLGSDQAASLALRDAGIPGLRYLDASSRGAQAKSQSRNFVIFDESAVQKTGELYQRQADMFPGEFATKRSTVPTGRVISSKGDTAEGSNTNSTGQQVTATKQGLQNFWNWFGNSVVADAKDRPLVLYHSTNADTNTLRAGQKSTNNYGILGDVDVTRAGIFMTPNVDFSQEYLRDGVGQNVMPLYAKIENPLDLRGGLSEQDEAALEAAGVNTRYVLNIQNYWELFDNADDGSNDFVDGLKRAGYDGAIFREGSPSGDTAGGDTYVAFASEQIKSAIGNDGTFDPTDPSMLSQQARGTFNPKTLELVLNPNTDLSTLWHEMGHFFLEVLQDVATQPNAPAQIAADYQTVLGWFGVTDEQWRAFSLDEKRKYHERWAESIEQYVMEGKVPNAELAPLMRRFAAWLKSAYTSIQKFIAARPDAAEIELNDDIRRVMDRMLATDQQIAEAEETAGLVFDEAATAAAQERLRKRSMADLKWTVKARDKVIRELQKKAKNERKRIEAEVTEEANALPAFAAKERLAELEKQHEADPFSADMNTAAVADAFGFASVDAMYREIEQAGEKQDYIDGRTEQRMLEEHGDLMNDDAIRAAANEAVHNDARARSLASELRTQAELLGTRTDTGQTTAKGAKVTTSALVEAAKQFGANVVARTPLRDLKNKAWQHTAAERRASKAWQAATAAGKTQEAVQAKQDQVLNHAAARAALDAQAEAKKIAEFFARVLKGNDEKTVEKGRDPDIVNAARAVLALYGMQSAASKTAAEYLKAVKANDPDAWSAIEDMVETASANAQPLSALTFEQLQGLHEQIEGMWFLARRSRQMEVNGDLLDIEDAAADLGARMDEIGIPDTVPGEEGALTKAEQRTRSIRFFGAALKRVEQWAEGMDGKYGGPFLKLVFQPIKDAADRYRKDRVVYRKKFQKLVDAIAPSMRHELIEAPELGYTFGRGHNGIGTAELLHALLHTGNDSNKRKLLLGRGWAAEGANGELDTAKWDSFVARLVSEGKLTTAHYDFLQGVWDLLEETKPLAQKAHRDVFGRYFAEVTATPFVDPFGAARRGGYVPAQADPEIVPDATLRSLAEMENESMAYSFPTTNKGFTKSRVEYNRPLKLDLRTLPQHLDKVLLFSHMEPAVRGVSKLLRQKGVSQPLNRIDPTAYAGTLLPWLNRAGKQIVETPIMGDGKTSRVLSVLRARAGAALMFANISNTVQQITGLSSAAVKVSPAHLMRAAANIIAHPKQARQAVWDASPYMAERASNEVSAMNGQLEAILLNPSLLERGQAWTNQHAYFLQSAFDNVLSPIVWTGAYNQAVEQGMTEEQAVKFADGVVRQTQGSTLPEDVSRIETGSPAVRMFTQFIGYFNMLANTNATAIKQIAGEVGLRKGAGRALYVALMGVLMPVWIAEAIAVAFRGGPDDEDKDGYLDDWLAAVFGMGTIKGVLAQVPFIGQLANAGINRTNNNPADDRMSLSPAVSLLEGAVGAPVSVYKAIVEDGSARKAVRDVASLVSIALGLPAVAVARPIGYAAGVEEGRIKPTGPVDMARGALTGAASPASR